jgi:hypothetical protein
VTKLEENETISFDMIINDKATLKFMTTDVKYESLIDDFIKAKIITNKTKIF